MKPFASASIVCAVAVLLSAMPAASHAQSFPGNTPDVAVRGINAEINKLFSEPEFVKFMVTQGLDSLAGTPEEFTAYMRRDREIAGEIIRKFKIPRQ